jgi:protein-S-isoprenylcysteine O-methyltransferase Ste14
MAHLRIDGEVGLIRCRSKTMSTPEVPASNRSHRTRISSRMAVVVGAFIVSVVDPFAFLVLPWLLSLLTPRLGWTEHGPAAWNMLGLFPVVAGTLGLVWFFSVMFAEVRKLPPVVELDEGEGLLTATSRVLITRGPFACSRNPRFLAATFIWLGWAIFYGSVVILIWTVVGWTFCRTGCATFVRFVCRTGSATISELRQAR